MRRLVGLAIGIGLGLPGLGLGMAALAGWLPETSAAANLLWLGGLAAVAIGIPVLAIGLVGSFLVWAFAPPAPPQSKPPQVPGPGWPGWELTLDGVRHEVWVGVGGMRFRVACDGAWVPTRTLDRNRVVFDLAGHPAILSSRRDRHGTRVPPGTAIHMSEAALMSLRFWRWDLEVDGGLRPDSERRLGPAPTSPHRGASPKSPNDPAPTSHPKPGRPLHLDPPRH